MIHRCSGSFDDQRQQQQQQHACFRIHAHASEYPEWTVNFHIKTEASLCFDLLIAILNADDYTTNVPRICNLNLGCFLFPAAAVSSVVGSIQLFYFKCKMTNAKRQTHNDKCDFVRAIATKTVIRKKNKEKFYELSVVFDQKCTIHRVEREKNLLKWNEKCLETEKKQ